jgi:hypothetical protein
MHPLTRILHVLALGLWFGSGLFFTFVVGLSLFDTFGKATANPPDQRPYCLPAPAELEKPSPDAMFPDPLRKEQGSRIAGMAVGPMFLPYYLLQVACGVVALLTALAWLGAGRIHRRRVFVLVLALAGAGVGWWLEGQVEASRVKRTETSDALFTSAAPSPEQKTAALVARAEFAGIHSWSLSANLLTLCLVTSAMGMAAFLPPRREEVK